MNFSDMTLAEFTDRLASGDAVPGGGGASALAGCLGTCLGSMVAHLTVGKKKYAGAQEDMEELIRKTRTLREELLALIDRDAEMFAPLSKTYSMPKSTPEEIAKRDEAMKEALNGACQAPLQIMEKMCAALELIRTAAEKGSSLAVSDAGDAAVFCKAALQGASLNVFINTKLMKDRTAAEDYNDRANRMLQEYVPLADRIYHQVLRQLAI